jgi:hypothetical protein
MGYKMERTHSIMRIATTASPVSGDAVREQMQLLKTRARFINAANLIMDRWNASQKEQMKQLRRGMSDRRMLNASLSSTRSLQLSPLQPKKKGSFQDTPGRLSSSLSSLSEHPQQTAENSATAPACNPF